MKPREAAVNRPESARRQSSIPWRLTLAVVPVAAVAVLASVLLAWALLSGDTTSGYTWAETGALAIAAVVIVVAVGTLISMYMTGRSMARRIDEVSSAATRVAQKDLVDLLDALRNPETDLDSIAQLRLDTSQEDEVGDLARSFEELHGSLIEVGARQMEALRAGVSSIFVTLARRNSSLVDRQLALLDSLEANEDDPEVLSGFYQLDHLATRMRRNSESLLVLAGSESPRVWAKPTGRPVRTSSRCSGLLHRCHDSSTPCAAVTARSYLFVPGDQPKMLSKATGRGADAVIVDLEDAVAVGLKEVARRETRCWLQAEEGQTPRIWVRVNHDPSLIEDDIGAVVVPALSGLVVPKVDTADQLERIGAILDAEERRSGLEQGAIRLIPMVETARGLLAVGEVALSPRVERLMIGEVDLAADLQLDSPDERTMATLRMPLVVVSAAAGIEPPVGPVSLDYRDPEELREGTIGLRRMGFGARPAIHPSQIKVINSVFTPTPEEVERSRQVLRLYEQAEEEGRGAVVDEGGRMVDKAVVRSARRTVELANRLGCR